MHTVLPRCLVVHHCQYYMQCGPVWFTEIQLYYFNITADADITLWSGYCCWHSMHYHFMHTHTTHTNTHTLLLYSRHNIYLNKLKLLRSSEWLYGIVLARERERVRE